MQFRLPRLAVPVALALYPSVIFANPEAVLAAATRALPNIAWERSSALDMDIDGDASPDAAILGYTQDRVHVAVFLGPLSRNSKPRTLTFAIDPGQQEAICEAPARLEAEELLCNPMGEVLPGCRTSKKAHHLVVRGGDCDPIVIYWNHKTGNLGWWRL